MGTMADCIAGTNNPALFLPVSSNISLDVNPFENIDETKQAVENLDAILSVPNLTGIYIGPADMSSSYGLPPKFDVREDPVFSNIKMIAKKAKEKGKIAGIHNGSVKYMKEMMEYGFQFTTLLSDFRMMTSHAESLLKELKNVDTKSDNTSAY